MNLWECDHRRLDGSRCSSTAVGEGGAIGLRAIGWWFMVGGRLLCPRHRPDPAPCGQDGEDCTYCAADAEADYFQGLIRSTLIARGLPI